MIKTSIVFDHLFNGGNTDRESILKELFAPGVGGNFTICRMPVAANDFARDWYSYNETEGDFEMKNFSIANDMQTLVPFIKNAKHFNPASVGWKSGDCRCSSKIS